MPNFRSLPKVDVLASTLIDLDVPESLRNEAARRAIDRLRDKIAAGGDVEPGEPVAVAAEIAEELGSTTLRMAVNMTGVILHTGLGRARMAQAAAEAVYRAAISHVSLELDLETGKRGNRQSHLRHHLLALTGADDAYVVNNGAAALMLTLNTLAAGGEVILSRGQMVEIGGSFRMPDIVRRSGCMLVEVGCTNKTHLSDFADAIGDNTKAILRCHPSNFKIIGFTHQPSRSELAQLCKARGILLIDDVGSGCLADLRPYGIHGESTLREAVEQGADIVTSSGDKLLGGPQAGIITGRQHLVARISANPLARTLRVDKLTVAGLEATLKLLRFGQHDQIPTLRYLSRPLEVVRSFAERLAHAYHNEAVVERGLTEIGGGSAPGVGVPTFRVGLQADDPDLLAAELRSGNPSIVGRIESETLWLDPRTAEAEEVEAAADALHRLSSR